MSKFPPIKRHHRNLLLYFRYFLEPYTRMPAAKTTVVRQLGEGSWQKIQNKIRWWESLNEKLFVEYFFCSRTTRRYHSNQTKFLLNLNWKTLVWSIFQYQSSNLLSLLENYNFFIDKKVSKKMKNFFFQNNTGKDAKHRKNNENEFHDFCDLKEAWTNIKMHCLSLLNFLKCPVFESLFWRKWSIKSCCNFWENQEFWHILVIIEDKWSECISKTPLLLQ